MFKFFFSTQNQKIFTQNESWELKLGNRCNAIRSIKCKTTDVSHSIDKTITLPLTEFA